MTIIQCERCWRSIEKKNNRVLCIPCANLRNKEVSKKYREEHREEIRAKNKVRAKEKRDKLKREL